MKHIIIEKLKSGIADYKEHKKEYPEGRTIIFLTPEEAEIVVEVLNRADQFRKPETKKEVEVALPNDEELEHEFRMIVSHAFLGEDENISREGFDLALKGCVEYVKKLI